MDQVEFIQAAGGATRLARKLSCIMQEPVPSNTVHNWLSRGIPGTWRYITRTNLQRLGFPPEPVPECLEPKRDDYI